MKIFLFQKLLLSLLCQSDNNKPKSYEYFKSSTQRNATQRQPLLCLSLSNSIKIFEKSKPAYEIFS